jgi:hypothetical protein
VKRAAAIAVACALGACGGSSGAGGTGGGGGGGGGPPPPRTGCAAAPTAPVAPGGYYVNGNTVCTADGRAHLFHGVDRPSLEWSKGGESLYAGDFVRMAGWGANVVRIALNQDFWLAASPVHDPNYPPLVDSAVAWAEAAGLDVILDLHWSDGGVLGGCNGGCQQRMPDANSLAFWSEVAARYAHDGRVLFELYNEPHDVSWDVWRAGGDSGDGFQAVGMQQLHDAVRAAGADNLVIIGGLGWGYDLSGVPAHRIAGHNIVYATHPYDNSRERDPRFWDLYWGFLTATDPVVVTEFGNPSGDCLTDYLAQVIQYADAHAAGWTAWAWFPGGCGFPALVSDWIGTPTAAGAVVRKMLQGYDDPPAAGRPGGGGDTRLTFAFDRSAEGWWIEDHADPERVNAGGTVTAANGALRLAARLTAVNAYARAVAHIGMPGLDLAGKTVSARVRLVSGRLSPGSVRLVALSGQAYDEGFGVAVDAAALVTEAWVPLSITLDATGNAAFRPAEVVMIGVELEGAGEVVIEVDGVGEEAP